VVGYNYGFEDWTATDPPTRWSVTGAASDVAYTPDSATTLEGANSMRVDLEDANVTATMGVRWNGSSDIWSTRTSLDQAGWQEITVWSPRIATAGLKPMLRIADGGSLPPGGANLWVDQVAISVQYLFTVGAVRDSEAQLIATAGSAQMHAAFSDDSVLYLAAPKGVSGSTDRFVFVFPGGVDYADPIAAPWAKTGVVWDSNTGHTLVLADEGDNSFCGWYEWNPAGTWDAIASGVACYDSFSDSGTVLAGTLDLVAHGGLTLPFEAEGDFTFASVEWGTLDSSGIVAQIPETAAPADDTIQPDETVSRHRSTLLANQIAP
jgi:hypothetical protein